MNVRETLRNNWEIDRQPGVSAALLTIPNSSSDKVQSVGIAWGDKYLLQSQL